MRTVKFTIPLTVTGKYSLNSIGDKYKKASIKKEIEEATYIAMKLHRLHNTKINTPVRITLYYDSGLDIDNHGFISKAIIDVVKIHLLNGDDNKNSVSELVQRFWDNKDIGVEIETVVSPSMPSKGKKK